jgi:hypothetical protein
MNKPSIKTLERAFPGKGRALRALLDSEKAVRAHPAAIERERTAYHPHQLGTLRMEALSAVAGCYGVEHVQAGDHVNSPGFDYLNTGDPYTPTIVRFYGGRYIVCDIGTLIERGNYA